MEKPQSKPPSTEPDGTMQAVVVRAYGGAAGFALERIAQPVPSAGQIRIAVAACGVSFLDGLVASGRYQVKPPLPFSPGSEFAGVVDEVGTGVSGYSRGDRVCASAVHGGFAGYVCVPATAVHQLPAAMRFEQAAVFGVPYATAFHALVQRGSLQACETLLVLGASGAVGSAAIQIGKLLGARVVAGASSAARREQALKDGADFAIDTSLPDWRTELKQVTGGQGVDVILDPVGGSSSEAAFRSLAWNGRQLMVGFASGTIPALPLNLPLVKGASLIGVELRRFNELRPALAATNFSQLLQAWEAGALRPVISEILPLRDFAQAMQRVEMRQAIGRVVLQITTDTLE